MFIENAKLAIIGLGYVGLPLAVEFGKTREVLGFDIDEDRIAELEQGFDRTLELSNQELKSSKGLKYSTLVEDLLKCNCYIVTVPTPVDSNNEPDMTFLFQACELIGRVVNHNDVIIFESTVYPGATEDDCAPLIERLSGLDYSGNIQKQSKIKENVFHLGYSPERINPGDKEHGLTKIVKVTSGSNPEVAEFVDKLYGSIITAGTYKAPSIRVAEAAKVIENTQRDLNIALVNELSKIFHLMGLDTQEILDAAGTKWNFLPFRPGLVGGHCIGVDPYYLTHKAKNFGYNPEVILSGRKINDHMGAYVAHRIDTLMKLGGIAKKGARILVLGLTFKPNCPDTRNSKVFDLIKELQAFGCIVNVNDPFLAQQDLPISLQPLFVEEPLTSIYEVVILAVAHQDYLSKGVETLKSFGKDECIFFDLQSAFPKTESHGRL